MTDGPLDTIRNSDPAILDNYAKLWDLLGDGLEGIFQRYVNEVGNIQGVHWEGEAATAAHDRATADQTTVQTLTDQLMGLSNQARAGATTIAETLRTARGYLATCDANNWSVSQQLLVTGGEGDSRELAQMNLNLTDAYKALLAADVSVADTLNALRGPLADAFSNAGGLGGDLGKNDGQQLATDPNQLTDTEIQRLIDAGQLTPEQRDALRAGEPVIIPVGQMDYLNNLARSLDGKSPQEINEIMNKLPPDARQALVNSLQFASTPAITTASKGDNTVPDNGGPKLLPTEIQQALTPGASIEDTAEVVALVQAGDASYRMGTGLDRALLDKAAANLESLNSSPVPSSAAVTDYKTPAQEALIQDIFNTVGDDKAAVAALVSDPDKGDRFLDDVLTRAWNDDGKAAANLFAFDEQAALVEDPTNKVDVKQAELSGNIMSAVGEYMADGEHTKKLMDLSGNNSETVGARNPELMQQLAGSMSPYIDELAGGHRDDIRGFTVDSQGSQNWVNPDGNDRYNGARNIFSLMNTDNDAAKIFNDAAAARADANGVEFGNNIDDRSAEIFGVTAARIEGLVDGGIFDNETDRVDDKDQYAKDVYKSEEQAYNIGKSITGAVVSAVPYAGPFVWAGVDGQSDAIKEGIIGAAPEPGERPQLARTDDVARIHNIVSSAEIPPDVQGQYPNLFENGSLKSWETLTTGPSYDVSQARTDLNSLLDALDGTSSNSTSKMETAYSNVTER